MMRLFEYKGPVIQFDKIVCKQWVGQTWAVSEDKAKANLTFQYKKLSGLVPNTKITLPGIIREIERV